MSLASSSSGPGSGSDSAGKRAFHPLKVARVIDETHDTRSIVFEIPPELAPAFRYRAGQFLTLEVEHEGARLRRCYSLASSPELDPEHKVTIKRVSGGRISNWVHDRVREGDVIAVLPPEGRFVLSAREGAILLFAGGSGITPVISLVKSALATTARPLRLLYANRDERSIIFREELEALQGKHPGRLEIIHRLDDRDGFLADADVARLVGAAPADDYYLCGPGPFMDTVERALLAAGVDPERVHLERFVSPSEPKAPVELAPQTDAPATIAMELNGVVTEVPYKLGQTLLQAARDAGLDAPYSCEEGFCGCCAALLLEGRVEMAADDALTGADKARGVVLTCQARPLTGRCALRFVEI
jgi:3-ketosteroid 9alpha-monooxygenase subunit B